LLTSQRLRSAARAIGVFDSGIGGLTVLRALRAELPLERFVYLGDTARLPYGTKSHATIQRYAVQAAQALMTRDIKCLVVACNTASAVALEQLQQHFAPVPVLGVVGPGAAAGAHASRSGSIAVIATESTVQGGAYQAAILRERLDARVIAKACPLFVALAEEGWISGAVVSAAAHRYLDPLFVDGPTADRPDTLVLGCTHFPVLAEVIRDVVGSDVAIVDSAMTTAKSLRAELERADLAVGSICVRPRVQFLATDGRERFARVGSVFLGELIAISDVDLVDLR
jgi:glutamate racemase